MFDEKLWQDADKHMQSKESNNDYDYDSLVTSLNYLANDCPNYYIKQQLKDIAFDIQASMEG